MTRLSACTIPLIGRPLEEAMAVIAAAGFRKIDLLGRMPHLSLDPQVCDPAALQAAAQAHGLQIANLGTYVGGEFASSDPAAQEKELQKMRRAIDLAAFFGARSIRVRPGNDDPACTERILPWLRQGAGYAAQKGIYMGIENHGGGISGRPTLCAELAEKVGSRFFGVLYEPCNLMASGADYRLALYTMREHVVHAHFKDAAVTMSGFRHTMLGAGQIDFPWIIEQLDALGYDGDLALEYEISDPPPEAGLQQWYRALEGLVS